MGDLVIGLACVKVDLAEKVVGRETHVAFPTNHFFAVVFACERLERGLDDAAAETEHQMES